MSYCKVPICVSCGERIVTAKSKNKRYCPDCFRVKHRTIYKERNRDRMRAVRAREQLERRRRIVTYSRAHKDADDIEIAREMGCSVGYVERTLVMYLVPSRHRR